MKRRNPAGGPGSVSKFQSGAAGRFDASSVAKMDPAKTTGAGSRNLSIDVEKLPQDTDTRFAERAVRLYGKEFVFDQANGWRRYNGKFWELDPDGWAKISDIGPDMRRQAADLSLVGDVDGANEILNAHKKAEQYPRRQAMAKIASTMLSRPGDRFDEDVNFLNCDNGYLDLESGELSRHRPEQYATKCITIPYEPKATCPRFLKFMEEIFEGDTDVIEFIQRLLGYCLSGDVSEHVMAVFIGDGANGKSTLMDVVYKIMGDYAGMCAPGLLSHNNGQQHPTELADLQGKRLSIVAETDSGLLKEDRVKRLTGGDVIKARRMHKDFVEFPPTHTFIMMSNHEPRITGADDGIWRRILKVPFNHQVPVERRDPHLAKKLFQKEAAGILAWMVRGFSMWRKQGLNPPESVKAATENYRLDQDILGEFIETNFVREASAQVPLKEAYKAYEIWADDVGETTYSNKMFAKMLRERGFDVRPGSRNVRMVFGAKIVPTFAH